MSERMLYLSVDTKIATVKNTKWGYYRIHAEGYYTVIFLVTGADGEPC